MNKMVLIKVDIYNNPRFASKCKKPKFKGRRRKIEKFAITVGHWNTNLSNVKKG